MIRTASAISPAAAALALAACGPAEPPSAPANEAAPAAADPAPRSCTYLVEFVDPSTLKPVAPALTVKEALATPRDAPCPQLPAGWRPLPSPVGGGADPAPGSATAVRLAEARAGGRKAMLTVSLLTR